MRIVVTPTAYFTVLLWENQLKQSTKSSVIGKASYNYGILLLSFHAQTLILLFSVKITLDSIFKWGNELWAKPGKSHLVFREGGEGHDICFLSPPWRGPWSLPSLPPPPQGSLPSGGLQCNGGEERCELRVTCVVKSCRGHLNLWGSLQHREPEAAEWWSGLALRERATWWVQTKKQVGTKKGKGTANEGTACAKAWRFSAV